MHPFLICLPIFLLVLFFDNINAAFDISDDCSNGRKITQFLTNQMGPSDAAVFIIAKKGPFNCKINYVTSKGYYVMVVIEFINWTVGQRHCGDEKNEIKLILRNGKEVQVCDVMDHNNYIFRISGMYDVTVSVNAVSDMGALKITSTSLRDPASGTCYSDEIPCKNGISERCMTRYVFCDGNINCGVKDKADEDKSACERPVSVNASMIFVGLWIVFITCVLVVALLRKLLPARKGTFIFKEDETLSESDRASGQRDYEIHIRVLYDTNEVQELDLIENENLTNDMLKDNNKSSRKFSNILKSKNFRFLK